jgi:pimeloyl-ACP methyl ester carboxylesterase
MGADQLYATVTGEGAPLLMIHGIIGDRTFFTESSQYLSSFYRVITYDRRGYGQNNNGQFTDYSVGTQAEDAANVLRNTCQEPAWILGNSAGGLIALELAMRYPGLVRGMVLMEPSLGYEEGEKEKLAAWNRELNEYVAQGKIKRALPAFSRVIGGGDGGEKTTSLKEMRQTYANLSAFMYGELNEVQHYTPSLEQLKQISVPVVIGVTERGRDSLFATSSLSAARLLAWPVVHFPGYHNVAREMPMDFSCMLHGILCAMEKK